MKLKEKFLSRKYLYQGKILSFIIDNVLTPAHNSATREYISHPGAVAILPFVDENNILLVRQFRYPVGKVLYEIPAGKIEKNKKESLKNCVLRELMEETGYTTTYNNVTLLFSFYPTPAFSTEKLHIFLAKNVKKSNNVEYVKDEDEFIEPLIISLDKSLELVKEGKICDAKTVIALWGYVVLKGEGWLSG
jgi:ADP-ribose pyrophosphatase